jgi:hypothetical protein
MLRIRMTRATCTVPIEYTDRFLRRGLRFRISTYVPTAGPYTFIVHLSTFHLGLQPTRKARDGRKACRNFENKSASWRHRAVLFVTDPSIRLQPPFCPLAS